jgi:hypothetical protein
MNLINVTRSKSGFLKEIKLMCIFFSPPPQKEFLFCSHHKGLEV